MRFGQKKITGDILNTPLPALADQYKTTPRKVSFGAARFPSLVFYSRFLAIILRASAKAKRGQYDDAEWYHSSIGIMRALEYVGVRFEISGIDNLKQLGMPCVVIANHMSILETSVLHSMILPFQRVTYIVKKGLLDYPVFRHVMRSRDPVAVGRANARQDLKAVLREGTDRLQQGISIIVFPQTTRTNRFDPTRFNSIGIKLARRADVPVLPLALRTDAWGNGNYFKDFGKIDVSKTACFAFGKPFRVCGSGSRDHLNVIDFIRQKLDEWQ